MLIKNDHKVNCKDYQFYYLFDVQQYILNCMKRDNYFQQATLLFYEAKYEQALRAINQFLEGKPRSSMGFNNRGLVNLSMGYCSAAKEDLQNSIQLNHLNYVAYFNLFSVYAREKEFRSALLALRGGLSCLCIIKGRLVKDKQLMSKAIELSTNNIDAILLLILMEVRDGNYDQALVLVEAAKPLKQNVRILQKLGVFITQLQQNYSEQTEESLFDYLIQTTPDHCQLSGVMFDNKQLGQQELMAEINSKIRQFNQLYSEINLRVGGVSYLIAKTEEQHLDNEIVGKLEGREEFVKKQVVMALQ